MPLEAPWKRQPPRSDPTPSINPGEIWLSGDICRDRTRSRPQLPLPDKEEVPGSSPGSPVRVGGTRRRSQAAVAKLRRAGRAGDWLVGKLLSNKGQHKGGYFFGLFPKDPVPAAVDDLNLGGGEGLPLQLGLLDRQVGVARAPDDQGRSIQIAQHRVERLEAVGWSRAVELEHRPLRGRMATLLVKLIELLTGQTRVLTLEHGSQGPAVGHQHEQLADHRRAPDSRIAVPAIADQRAGVDQGDAGKRIWVSQAPG